jgi:hypothetical protein
MANNPLQQYFRQPKIFINLPSQGVYNKPGSIQGEVSNMPIFGMTGMDEILMKTPDALLTGESTVKVMQSCCPGIVDGWEVTNLDFNLILTAIRIATFGNSIAVSSKCTGCGTDNDYEIDLTRVVDYFSHCSYDNKIVYKNLVIKTKPLTYKQITDFALRNFQLQQRLNQNIVLTDEEEKKKNFSDLFGQLAELQNEIFTEGIEHVTVDNAVVNEKEYIREWLANCDRDAYEDIKTTILKNQEKYSSPEHDVECSNCGKAAKLTIDLDQASFFGNA